MNYKKTSLLFMLPISAVSSFVYANDFFNVEQVQKVLLPDADTFISVSVKFTDEQKKKIEEMSGTKQRSDDQKVWKAEKKGKLIGYFIVDDVLGKHDYITYGTAISADGKVLGIEIMSYRESFGAQVRNSEWRNKFKGKTVSDQFKLDVDVPNISGATLSCRHVLDGVKRLLVIQQIALGK